MKKILLAASLVIASATFAGTTHFNTGYKMEKGDGRHISESEVPSKIVNAFYTMYPGAANVKWEVEREHGHKVYQAEFMLNGKKKKAEFTV